MNKKDLERVYFDSFVEKLGIIPIELDAENENPDLVFRSESGVKIGVEITRLYRKSAPGQSSLKEQEALREQITRRACALYSERGHPPVHMSVHFSLGRPVRKPDIGVLAEQLVALAVRNLPDMGGRRDEEYTWTNRAYFPEAIDLVMLFRSANLTKATFSAPSVSFSNEYGAEFFEQRIAEKNLRVPDYLKRCDLVWLVLCSGGDMLSSVIELNQSAQTHTYRTVFERVYWLRWPHTLTELKIEKPV